MSAKPFIPTCDCSDPNCHKCSSGWTCDRCEELNRKAYVAAERQAAARQVSEGRDEERRKLWYDAYNFQRRQLAKGLIDRVRVVIAESKPIVRHLGDHGITIVGHAIYEL